MPLILYKIEVYSIVILLLKEMQEESNESESECPNRMLV